MIKSITSFKIQLIDMLKGMRGGLRILQAEETVMCNDTVTEEAC